MSEAEWFEAHRDKGHDVGNRREDGRLVTSTCHDCEERWFADQSVTPDRPPENDEARDYVSRLWAEDWDSDDDTMYDLEQSDD